MPQLLGPGEHRGEGGAGRAAPGGGKVGRGTAVCQLVQKMSASEPMVGLCG